MRRAVLGAAAAGTAVLGCMCAAALAGALGSQTSLPSPTAIADIPAAYLDRLPRIRAAVRSGA